MSNDLPKKIGPLYHIEDESKLKELVGWYYIFVDDSNIKTELEVEKKRMIFITPFFNSF